MKVRPITYICATVMYLCTITVRSQTEFQKEKLLTYFLKTEDLLGSLLHQSSLISGWFG